MNNLRIQLALLIAPELGETIKRLRDERDGLSGVIEDETETSADLVSDLIVAQERIEELERELERELDEHDGTVEALQAALERGAEVLIPSEVVFDPDAASWNREVSRLKLQLAEVLEQNADLKRRLSRTHTRDASGRFVKVVP